MSDFVVAVVVVVFVCLFLFVCSCVLFFVLFFLSFQQHSSFRTPEGAQCVRRIKHIKGTKERYILGQNTTSEFSG